MSTLTFPDDLRGAPRAPGLEVVLELTIGLSALSGGLTLVFSPDGSAMGIDRGLLEGSGFASFFWPGVLLAFVVGCMNLVAAALTLMKSPLAASASLLGGGALVVFIVVETLLVTEHSFLQPLCLAIGLAIAALSLPKREPTV